MSNDQPAEQQRRMQDPLTPRRVVALVLTVVAVLFVFLNRDDVTLNLLGIRVTGPLWLSSLVLLLVGIVIGYLLTARRRSGKSGGW